MTMLRGRAALSHGASVRAEILIREALAVPRMEASYKLSTPAIDEDYIGQVRVAHAVSARAQVSVNVDIARKAGHVRGLHIDNLDALVDWPAAHNAEALSRHFASLRLYASASRLVRKL
jgi:hypothetical protein